MTSRPELKLGNHLLPGLVAVALFAVMAFVFLQTPFAAADPTPNTDGFAAETEVANVSVDSGTSVERRSDGVYAVQGDSEERLTQYTGANGTIVNAGGNTYAVATIPTSVTESLGYAMFNLNALPDRVSESMSDRGARAAERDAHSRSGIASEGFLVAFEIIDVVLVAALIAAVMLARRDDGRVVTTALGGGSEDEEVATDGGTDGGDR